MGRADEERVVELAEALVGQRLRVGDTVLMDSRSGLLLERLPRQSAHERGAERLQRRELLRLAAVKRRLTVPVEPGFVGDAYEEPVRFRRKVDDKRGNARDW